MEAGDINSVHEESGFPESEVKGMFDGKILPLLIRLTLPILGGLAVQILYNITDRIWISRINLNDHALVGGPGIIFPILLLAVAVGTGLQVGMSSLVARAIGEKNKPLLSKVTESGLLIAITTAIILSAAFYIFDKRIVSGLGAEGDLFIHALDYFRYIIPAGAGVFLGMILMGILQGEGQMDKVMWAMIIGTIGNIVLDPIFIFLFKMGVRGAGLATTIAQTLSVIYLLTVFLRKKSIVQVEWKLTNIKGTVVWQILSTGLPQAISQVTIAFSILIFNRIIVSIDEQAVTAYVLYAMSEQVVLLPVWAMGSAMLTMVAQNAGRGLVDRVRKIWKTTIFSSFVVVSLLATVVFIFAPKIYPLFTDITKVAEYAVTQTRIVIYPYIIAAIGILFAYLFQGIGKPIPALILILLRSIGLAIPFMLITVYAFDWKMYGVWGGIVFGNIVGTAMALIWSKVTMNKLVRGEIHVLSTSSAKL